MLTLIWSFRNRIDILKQSIETAHTCSPISVNFCLVDAASTDETIKELREFVNKIEGRKIRICESVYRTTLPQAWNLGIMLSNTRYVAFASSDVLFLNKNFNNLIICCLLICFFCSTLISTTCDIGMSFNGFLKKEVILFLINQL